MFRLLLPNGMREMIDNRLVAHMSRAHHSKNSRVTQSTPKHAFSEGHRSMAAAASGVFDPSHAPYPTPEQANQVESVFARPETKEDQKSERTRQPPTVLAALQRADITPESRTQLLQSLQPASLEKKYRFLINSDAREHPDITSTNDFTVRIQPDIMPQKVNGFELIAYSLPANEFVIEPDETGLPFRYGWFGTHDARTFSIRLAQGLVSVVLPLPRNRVVSFEVKGSDTLILTTEHPIGTHFLRAWSDLVVVEGFLVKPDASTMSLQRDDPSKLIIQDANLIASLRSDFQYSPLVLVHPEQDIERFASRVSAQLSDAIKPSNVVNHATLEWNKQQRRFVCRVQYNVDARAIKAQIQQGLDTKNALDANCPIVGVEGDGATSSLGFPSGQLGDAADHRSGTIEWVASHPPTLFAEDTIDVPPIISASENYFDSLNVISRNIIQEEIVVPIAYPNRPVSVTLALPPGEYRPWTIAMELTRQARSNPLISALRLTVLPLIVEYAQNAVEGFEIKSGSDRFFDIDFSQLKENTQPLRGFLPTRYEGQTFYRPPISDPCGTMRPPYVFPSCELGNGAADPLPGIIHFIPNESGRRIFVFQQSYPAQPCKVRHIDPESAAIVLETETPILLSNVQSLRLQLEFSTLGDVTLDDDGSKEVELFQTILDRESLREAMASIASDLDTDEARALNDRIQDASFVRTVVQEIDALTRMAIEADIERPLVQILQEIQKLVQVSAISHFTLLDVAVSYATRSDNAKNAAVMFALAREGVVTIPLRAVVPVQGLNRFPFDAKAALRDIGVSPPESNEEILEQLLEHQSMSLSLVQATVASPHLPIAVVHELLQYEQSNSTLHRVIEHPFALDFVSRSPQRIRPERIGFQDGIVYSAPPLSTLFSVINLDKDALPYVLLSIDLNGQTTPLIRTQRPDGLDLTVKDHGKLRQHCRVPQSVANDQGAVITMTDQYHRMVTQAYCLLGGGGNLVSMTQDRVPVVFGTSQWVDRIRVQVFRPDGTLYNFHGSRVIIGILFMSHQENPSFMEGSS